jgi:hypothetical protein
LTRDRIRYRYSVVSIDMDNMDDDSDPPGEARIIPNGELIEDGIALYEGSTTGAREYLLAMPPELRAEVAIWTPGHVFDPDKFLAERPGHEHDPIGEG